MSGKREEQIKEIMERLEQGVQELFTSEKYVEYLKAMSQFHAYSFNNTVLIARQKPEATLVAGYGTWQKKFNRQVKRGEKGIKIIAPAPVKHKEEIEKMDPETNKPVLRPDGQPETEEVERVIPRFRVVTVFDVSQTYGDPLPELDMPKLMGSVENFPVFMEAIGMVSPVPMRYAKIEGEAKGYYSNADKEIVLREGMSEKQTMKTAVHEVTHAMCHDRDLLEELGKKKNQMTKEVEAESVAYAVCGYFDLDTSDYSFPYIAGWSSGMEMKELRTSMDFIRKTTGSFIDDMVENIQELQKEKARGLEDDALVFQVDFGSDGSKKFYLVNDTGKADFLRLLRTFTEQGENNGDLVRFLKDHGAQMRLWKDSENLEKNESLPNFYDILYKDAEHIVDAADLPTLKQAEMLIGRAEHGCLALGKETHDLVVQYAYKLDDLEDTSRLVKELKEAAENADMRDVRQVMEDAQAAIDALPDRKIGLTQMHEFGCHDDSVLPLTAERAVTLHDAGLHVYSLQKDGSSILMNTEQDILEVGGIFGVDVRAWESYQVMEAVRAQEVELKMETKINAETMGFMADGHFGTWHTAEEKEISGELFYRMEHEAYGNSVPSIIVNQEGKLVAEDLEHGFDQGALDAINEYFAEKGKVMGQEQSADNIVKTHKDRSGGSKKQSVLNALRERQAKIKAQEKEKLGQKPQARKGEQER